MSPGQLFCAIGMSFLSGGGPAPTELIRQTYDELWQTLARTPEVPALARTVRSEGDPFRLPPGQAEELQSLRRRLTDFQRMLDINGWDTQDIRQSLLDVLARRIGDYD